MSTILVPNTPDAYDRFGRPVIFPLKDTNIGHLLDDVTDAIKSALGGALDEGDDGRNQSWAHERVVEAAKTAIALTQSAYNIPNSVFNDE